jgi:hypothetical protein
MVDRATPRYTVLSEPAHEARIAQDLARAATGIASELGDSLGALWLVGPFARGEGGLVMNGRELAAYPGYPLIAVLRRKPERHVVALQALAGAWSRLLGTRITLVGIGLRSVPQVPCTRFWLQASQGGIVTLAGDTQLAATLPNIDPAQLPAREPAETIAAALTAVALGELEQANARRKAEHLQAAALAIGDAWLMRSGRLAPTRAERARDLGRARGGRELLEPYKHALEFSTRPDRWTPPSADLTAWLVDARRALSHSFLTTEAARLGTPSHVFGYLRHPESVTQETTATARARRDAAPHTVLRRARVLALRVPALAAFAVDPLERLLRAALALAFAADAPACRTQAAGLLRIGTTFGAAGDEDLARTLRQLAKAQLEDPIGAPFVRLEYDPDH